MPGSDRQRRGTGQRRRRKSGGGLAAVVHLTPLLLLAWLGRGCSGKRAQWAVESTDGGGNGGRDAPLHARSPAQPHQRADRHVVLLHRALATARLLASAQLQATDGSVEASTRASRFVAISPRVAAVVLRLPLPAIDERCGATRCFLSHSRSQLSSAQSQRLSFMHNFSTSVQCSGPSGSVFSVHCSLFSQLQCSLFTVQCRCRSSRSIAHIGHWHEYNKPSTAANIVLVPYPASFSQ